MSNNIYDVILELRNTNSLKQKLNILRNNVLDSELKRFLKLCYGKHIKKYKVKPVVNDPLLEFTLSDLMDFLEEQYTSGNDLDDDTLYLILAGLNDIDFELSNMIFNKNIHAGIGIKTINKCWRDLVSDHAIEYNDNRFGYNYVFNNSVITYIKVLCDDLIFLDSNNRVINVNDIELIDSLYEMYDIYNECVLIGCMDMVYNNELIIEYPYIGSTHSYINIDIHDVIKLTDWKVGKTSTPINIRIVALNTFFKNVKSDKITLQHLIES